MKGSNSLNCFYADGMRCVGLLISNLLENLIKYAMQIFIYKFALRLCAQMETS